MSCTYFGAFAHENDNKNSILILKCILSIDKQMCRHHTDKHDDTHAVQLKINCLKAKMAYKQHTEMHSIIYCADCFNVVILGASEIKIHVHTDIHKHNHTHTHNTIFNFL